VLYQVTRVLDMRLLDGHIRRAGLRLIAGAIGHPADGTVRFLQDWVHDHIPLTQTVRNEHGDFTMVVRRCTLVNVAYTNVGFEKHFLRSHDQTIVPREPFRTVKDFNLSHGGFLDYTLRPRFGGDADPPGSLILDIRVMHVASARPDQFETSYIDTSLQGGGGLEAAFRRIGVTAEDASLTRPGRTIQVRVFPNTLLGELKQMLRDRLYDHPAVFDQRLVLNGVQLTDDGMNLDDHGVRQNHTTLHLLYRLRGGKKGKRGVKRASKSEKMAQMRAKAQYAASMVVQTHAPTVNYVNVGNQVSDPNYAMAQLGTMNLQQATVLQTAMDGIRRGDRMGLVIAHLMNAPLAGMMKYRDELDVAIDAIQQGFDTGFAEAFIGEDGQYDVTPFEDAATARLQVLTAEQAREEGRQQGFAAAAQHAAAAAAPAPAPAAAAAAAYDMEL
jgi:hypothetical protein